LNQSLKLFFSYGHDANAWLVNRIAADLRAEGHEVWLDADKIRPGDDWRRAILDGEVDHTQVLAFLSRHSVRESSVCLDEIAIALHLLGGQIIPILLEPESEVQPPVSVTHVQWLDLSGWPAERAKGEAEFAAWYAAQLQAIRAILADPQRAAFAGEIERLHGLLLPPEPARRGHQARRIGALLEGFVGRQWLMDRVEAWRTQQPDSTLLWLAGEGGMGKSAFAAHLTHYGRGSVIALNLSEYNDGATREPGLVIRALAYQLATREPSYRRNLLAVLERGPIQGTPSELFRRLILEPLGPSIDGRRSHDPSLIVLDGLDETMRGNQCELAEILAECHARLPKWIKLLVTSRDIPAIRNQLKDFSPQDVRFGVAENRADLEIYARGWLGGQGLADAALDRAVCQVTAAAAGNMLYLTLLKRGVAEARIALDDPQGLPPGLTSIYTRWLRRVFPVPLPDPKTGAVPPYPTLPDYERDFLPMLGLLLCTARPVPEAVLREALGLDVRSLRKRLEPMAVLLTQGSAGWAPSHKSLRDWLLDPDLAGADFVVDPAEGQARLRDWLWARFAALVATRGAGEAFFLAEFPRQMESELPALRVRVAVSGGGRPLFAAASRIATRFAKENRAEPAVAWWEAASSLAEAGAPEVEGLSAAYFASMQAGELLLRVVGQLDLATRDFRRAQALSERLGKLEPDIARWQLELSICHDRIGDVLSAQGESAAALVEFRSAMAIRQRLASAEPSSSKWQLGLSISHDRIGGVLLAQGEGAAALHEFRAAMAIQQQLANADPTNAETERGLFVSYNNIGDVLVAQGKGAAALAEFRVAKAIAQRLINAAPNNAQWQRDLSIIHSKIGDVLMTQREVAAALAEFRAGIDIAQRLANADPNSAERKRDVAVNHERIGNVLRAQGEDRAALAEFRAGMAIVQRLADADPTNAVWQHDLSVSHNKIGDVLRAQGESAAALAEFRTGLTIRQRLANKNPANANWQIKLFVSHWQLAHAAAAIGDKATFFKHINAARSQGRFLVAQFPERPESQQMRGAADSVARKFSLPDD
jgi:tetratricopeptide (TPR) repeat protein